MTLKQGIQTAKFGEWLTDYLKNIPKYKNYLVYYGHGDKQIHPDNVIKIKGFYGKHVKNKNRLADIDIMVASPHKEILLLIEIEERSASPKKYIGAVFAALMCNNFAVGIDNQNDYFKANDESKFIVAGILPTNRRIERFDKIIGPRITQFVTPPDSIKPQNVIFDFSKDIVSTIESLKKKIMKMFPSGTHGDNLELESEKESFEDLHKIQINQTCSPTAPKPPQKGWYFWVNQNNEEYILAFVNAKRSCSIRRFKVDDGVQVKRIPNREGNYQDSFSEYLKTAKLLYLSRQPNLEKNCRKRLPEWVMSELREQIDTMTD